MSGILDLLNSDLGKTIINGVSKESGQPQDKTNNLLTMALPVLMQAMKRNATTPQGADGLMGAISNRHDGSILNDLEGLFSGGVNTEIKDDGAKILGHVLGNKQSTVERTLSQKSGIDAGSVAQILKVAAPILMGVLGQQKRRQAVHNTSDLEGFLGGMLKGSAKQEQSFLESILDADGDGSIIDDVAGMVLGNGKQKKKSGLGSLLGGLFGKR